MHNAYSRSAEDEYETQVDRVSLNDIADYGNGGFLILKDFSVGTTIHTEIGILFNWLN